MDEHDMLAERFEAHRARLRAVAYQTMGSASEADDAVQEAWLRLSRTDPGNIENLGGWLTTVVARVCLNMLQSRREQPVGQIARTSLHPPLATRHRTCPGHRRAAAPILPGAFLACGIGRSVREAITTETNVKPIVIGAIIGA